MDEIRKRLALLDMENEIKYRKQILNSGASEEQKKFAKKRIQEVEAMMRQLKNSK